MPLGLMPGMRYEEKEITLEADEAALFYSDGLVEAWVCPVSTDSLPLGHSTSSQSNLFVL
jgi:serine phosphatase RsbU (regulator of sigma subunit)